MLTDIFENFRNICLKTYELDDPSKFLSAPGSAWQAALKKDQSKIRSFNWYWYVINGKKGIRGGICHSVYPYARANNKYMKDYNKKIKNCLIVLSS